MQDTFKEEMVAVAPVLRALAAKLAGSRCEVDDLVQETFARALRYRDSFQPGSSMTSWLCKILQNCFYQACNRTRYLVEDVGGREAARQCIAPSQEWRARTRDLLKALERLSPDARDALLLVGAHGLSYEEAAEHSACPVGTLKSRVNRARERLADLAGDDRPASQTIPSALLEEPAV